MANEGPPEQLSARVAELLKRQPVAWRRTTGGYSTAERWIVTFEDGSSAFVKSGAAHLATFLRAEYGLVYSRLSAPFLPKLLAWVDDGVTPILVLTDLSRAHWPPPWLPWQVDAVLAALDDLQAFSHELPSLPAVEDAHAEATLLTNWPNVRATPEPFLSLALCTEAWLEHALPLLAEAGASAPIAGTDVLHLDVRSDNICFADKQAILVDWNHVCRGNRELDIAFWLPSLHSEGGPRPEEVRELAPSWAAVVAGYFAARAGLPVIPQAPLARRVQLSQLRAALPWAVRALGLPPLDGPAAPQ